jgi:hypothetical protein
MMERNATRLDQPPASIPGAPSRFWAFYAVLVGPLVWFAHFVLVWAVAEMGCIANYANMPVLTPSAIRTVVAIATFFALAAIALGLFVGWRWRDAVRQGGVTMAESRAKFLIQVGLSLSVLFFVSIVVTAIPAFVIGVCDTAV